MERALFKRLFYVIMVPLGYNAFQERDTGMHHLDGEERRRYPRSKRQVQVVMDDRGPGILNHIDNISEAGVLCHTIKPVALMTKIGILLDLPKPFEHRIDAEGVVVRCDPEELGDDHFKVAIFFTKLSETDKEAIQEFVAWDENESEDLL